MSAEKYSKSPITEALIDIQIDPGLSVPASVIEDAHTKIMSNYPKKKPWRVWEARLEFKDQGPVQTESPSNGIQGFQFWSTDDKKVIQFRLNGFSFSRLKPYVAWESSLPEALEAWEVYRKTFSPSVIKRVAVRYINSFEIPAEKIELKDYFVNPPESPSGVSQEIEGFLSRLIIRLGPGTHGIVTFASQPNATPGVLSFVLDIDVFSDVRFGFDLAILKSTLEHLHAQALAIFKSSITKKTESLIK